MAIRYAVANGNWSSTSTWDGGASIPASNDDVRTNGFNVTIDQNVTCLSFSNKTESSPSIASGGYGILTNGITFEATDTGSVGILNDSNTTNSKLFLHNLTSGQTCTVKGKPASGAVSTACIVAVTGSGELIFNANGYGINFGSGNRLVRGDTGCTLQNLEVYCDTTVTAAGAALIDLSAGTMDNVEVHANVNMNSSLVVTSTGTIITTLLVDGNTIMTSNNHMLYILGAVGDLIINGSCNATGGGYSVALVGSSGSISTITINGDLDVGSAYGILYAGITNGAIGTITVNGNCYNAASPNSTAINSLDPSITITGDVVCASSGATAPVILTSGGNISVYGKVYAGAVSAITNSGTSAVGIFTDAIYASPTAVAIVFSSATAEVRVTGPLYSAQGAGLLCYSPVFCTSLLFTPSSPGLAWSLYEDDNATPVHLYYAGGTPGMPAPSDVRYGTSFDVSGSQTGTMAVPPAASVAYGVPVDATTGTAIIDPDTLGLAIMNVLRSESFVAGSMGERLKNAATIESIGSQMAALGTGN